MPYTNVRAFYGPLVEDIDSLEVLTVQEAAVALRARLKRVARVVEVSIPYSESKRNGVSVDDVFVISAVMNRHRTLQVLLTVEFERYDMVDLPGGKWEVCPGVMACALSYVINQISPVRVHRINGPSKEYKATQVPEDVRPLIDQLIKFVYRCPAALEAAL